MLIPIRTDSPLRTTPWMNWLLIAANVLIFVLVQPLAKGRPQLLQHYLLNPRDLSLLPYLSYAFLHHDGVHLLGNMLFLYIFGNNVNDRMGNLGYLGFYLAGAVFAGIGHVLTSDANVLGASGAVAAVTGAYLVLLPRSHITFVYFWILIGVFELPSLYLILFFFLLQDVVFFLIGSVVHSDVAHMAHIAGTLFGIAVCMGLLAVKLLPRDQFDVLALLQRWNRRRQFRSMVREGFDPFSHIPSQQNGKTGAADPKWERIQALRGQISEALTQRDHARAAAAYRDLVQLDPDQVLSRSGQLDVATQLASEGAYETAAQAYEVFLRQYANYEQIEQVQLMLGLIYARYLQRYAQAREHLNKALGRLQAPREVELARTELARVQPLIPAAK